MRLFIVLFSILVIVELPTLATQAIEVGSKIGDFQLTQVLGGDLSLQSHLGKVVVLIFWSFKCPVSLAYADRMEGLQKKYREQGVVVYAVCSGAGETPAEIRANLTNLGISIPVLLDSEGRLAEKLGATHTPAVYILDGNGVLRYRGAIDNNKKPGESGRVAYADDAIDSILKGRRVVTPETKPFGCAIKISRY